MNQVDDNNRNITHNVTSHKQSGGVTAHTVNVGPQPRTLNLKLQKQILSELPKDKPITVVAVLGDGEAFQLGQQIHTFMKQNGFTMTEQNGISQAVFSQPVKGLIVEPEGDGFKFVVGSNLP